MKRQKSENLQSASGSFIQGFVAAGCVSAFQDRAPVQASRVSRRVVRHALQGGVALSAGCRAADAWRRQEYMEAALASVAGAVGVLLVERMLSESQDVQEA